MLVTDIAVSRQTYCPVRGVHTANVSLTFADRVVRLICNVRNQNSVNDARNFMDFVKDALRQMGRMPEYRSGRDHLRLSPDLSRRLEDYPSWLEMQDRRVAPVDLSVYRLTEKRLAA